MPAVDTPIATYLHSRGISLAAPDSVRFHPRLKHPGGGTWPRESPPVEHTDPHLPRRAARPPGRELDGRDARARGDLSGLPPTLVQVSDSEMLYDDARRYVNKARAAGSPACLQSWSGLLHVWQLFYPEVPEAGAAWKRVAEFLERSGEPGASPGPD